MSKSKASATDTKPRAAWPPAPAGGQYSDNELPYSGDIRDFKTQNCVLLLLLILVTFGLYVPFWMYRTANVINRIAPDRTIPTGLVWLMLAFQIVGYLIGVASVIAETFMPSTGPISLSHRYFSMIVWLFYLSMAYRIRDALNVIVARTSPSLGKWDGLSTLLFGPVYLQYGLNKRIKQRAKEPG
jgi:hypothetical protein